MRMCFDTPEAATGRFDVTIQNRSRCVAERKIDEANDAGSDPDSAASQALGLHRDRRGHLGLAERTQMRVALNPVAGLAFGEHGRNDMMARGHVFIISPPR